MDQAKRGVVCGPKYDWIFTEFSLAHNKIPPQLKGASRLLCAYFRGRLKFADNIFGPLETDTVQLDVRNNSVVIPEKWLLHARKNGSIHLLQGITNRLNVTCNLLSVQGVWPEDVKNELFIFLKQHISWYNVFSANESSVQLVDKGEEHHVLDFTPKILYSYLQCDSKVLKQCTTTSFFFKCMQSCNQIKSFPINVLKRIDENDITTYVLQIFRYMLEGHHRGCVPPVGFNAF